MRSLHDDRDTEHMASQKPSPFLMAAAVLTVFDPEEIRPVGQSSEAQLKDSFHELIAKSVVNYDPDANPIWSLRGDVRRHVFERLKDRKVIISCLRANPRRYRNSLQKMLERYLAGQAPPVSEQNSYQLSDTLQVIDWLGGIIPGVPKAEEIRERMERESLTASEST